MKRSASRTDVSLHKHSRRTEDEGNELVSEGDVQSTGDEAE